MTNAKIVSRDEWLRARLDLLTKEKEFTRARDALSAQRRELPWTPVTKDYSFETPQGRKSLADLFDGRGQLVVYHFMYGPNAKQPCKSCSFWADNFDHAWPHLGARDTTMLAISRAPLKTLDAFKQRMGWTFPWVSSGESDFNYDFAVSFRGPPEGNNYNFATQRFGGEDAPGISVFARDDKGHVHYTYSTYSRGLDMMNGAYHYLDLTPKGRDEAGSHKMQWVRYRDEYAG